MSVPGRAVCSSGIEYKIVLTVTHFLPFARPWNHYAFLIACAILSPNCVRYRMTDSLVAFAEQGFDHPPATYPKTALHTVAV